MKTKTILTLLYACTFFAACLDDYNTTHPNHGTVTLATDWGQRTGGIDQPASYTVQVGDYSATVGDVTATLDHLFAPGVYRLRTYNTPAAHFCHRQHRHCGRRRPRIRQHGPVPATHARLVLLLRGRCGDRGGHRPRVHRPPCSSRCASLHCS